MPTSPPACPRCKGSGRVIVLHRLSRFVDPSWRTVAGIGFSQVTCPMCYGRGTLEPPDTHGSYTWPKETVDGSDQDQG